MTIASAAPNFRVQMSTLSGEIPESEGRIVQVHEASSTRFRVTRDNGFTEQYDGSFSYNGGGVSGTINTYTLSRNGAVLLTITGANAPIDQGQITPAVAFFAGDDRLEGSDLDDQLVAFNGNDAVIGKAGNDFLIGGCRGHPRPRHGFRARRRPDRREPHHERCAGGRIARACGG
jgi:hypothetical protein